MRNRLVAVAALIVLFAFNPIFTKIAGILLSLKHKLKAHFCAPFPSPKLAKLHGSLLPRCSLPVSPTVGISQCHLVNPLPLPFPLARHNCLLLFDADIRKLPQPQKSAFRSSLEQPGRTVTTLPPNLSVGPPWAPSEYDKRTSVRG